MPWFRKYFLQAPEGDGGSGGGGGAGGDGGKGGEGDGGKPDLAAENAALKARLADLEKKGSGGGGNNEGDLSERARQQREADSKKESDHAALESSVRFTLSGKEFLKENEAALPKEVADIFAAADKEKFDSSVHKANAIRDGIIQEFFKVQANLDLLTSTQKKSVEKYLTLTKTGREGQALHVFENILEPTLEAQKRIKKAEEVNRAKGGFGNDADRAYREKLMAGSRKHYIGEKK